MTSATGRGARIEPGPLGHRFGHRQVGIDGALLEDDAHLGPEAARTALGVHPQHRDRAGVSLAVALEDLHRRGLPGSVRPEQGQDLPSANLEVDAPDGDEGPVGLGQSRHRDGDVVIVVENRTSKVDRTGRTRGSRDE